MSINPNISAPLRYFAEVETAAVTVTNLEEETTVVEIKAEEPAAEVLRVFEMLEVLVELGAAAGTTENTKLTMEWVGRVAFKMPPPRETGKVAGDETELSIWYGGSGIK